MNAWLNQHLLAVRDAARRLIASPLGTLLSLCVIAIALTLPAAGWLLVENVQRTARSAAGIQQISIFMALDADRKAVEEISSRLKANPPGDWRFVPREEALKRLQGGSRMGDLAAGLPRNPLPDAFVVEPTDTSPAAMERLAKSIADWPRVAHVQLDTDWVRRVDAFVRIGKLVVSLLAGIFGAALVLATFNTIRLQILAHAAEIEVARLIGATDGWIRRPFAYYGALQGALGGLLAFVFINAGKWLLAPSIAELAQLYDASFSQQGPSAAHALLLVTCGALLGWIGAFLSVSLSLRHPK